MTSLAPVSALETRLGRLLSGAERERAEAVLADVSELVRDAGRRSWTAETAPATAVVVTVGAARRVFLNPDGYAQEALGDASVRLPEAVAAVGPYLTDRETAMIKSAARRAAFSVRTPSAYPEALA